jgi:chromosome segregation ATPase
MNVNIKQEPEEIELPLQEKNLNTYNDDATIKQLNDIISTLRATNKKQRLKLFNFKNNYQQLQEENAELKKKLAENNNNMFNLQQLEDLQAENLKLRRELDEKSFNYKILDGLRVVAQEEVKTLKKELEESRIMKENLLLRLSNDHCSTIARTTADANYLSLKQEILTMEQRFCEFKKKLSEIEYKNISNYNERICLIENNANEIVSFKEKSIVNDVKNIKLKRLQNGINGDKLRDIK